MDNRLQHLYDLWINRKANPEEVEEFYHLMKEGGLQKLTGLQQEVWDSYETHTFYSRDEKLSMADRIIGQSRVVSDPQPPTRTYLLQNRWMRYAAILLILAGGGIYHWFYKDATAVSIAAKANHAASADLRPGTDRAVLTLADGTAIMLDSAANGALAKQGGVKILKLNTGALAYRPTASPAGNNEILYNTISTPRGGQYQLILGDGTKVWLNAASSLRFPARFAANKRSVEVSGEAYFEIAADKSRPFTVKADSVNVQVLGTAFNVNAYADEGTINTTLINGSVRIAAGRNVQLLAPGSQAQVKQQDLSFRVLKDVDQDQVMAWKDGKFRFNETSIESGMRQISRWYDVEVGYEGKIPDQRFNGVLSRSNSLAKVLKVLELGDVHFRIEGKKIIVMP